MQFFAMLSILCGFCLYLSPVTLAAERPPVRDLTINGTAGMYSPDGVLNAMNMDKNQTTSIVLRPVKTNQRTAEEVAQRTASGNFEDLDLQTQLDMINGSPGGTASHESVTDTQC